MDLMKLDSGRMVRLLLVALIMSGHVAHAWGSGNIPIDLPQPLQKPTLQSILDQHHALTGKEVSSVSEMSIKDLHKALESRDTDIETAMKKHRSEIHISIIASIAGAILCLAGCIIILFWPGGLQMYRSASRKVDSCSGFPLAHPALDLDI